MTSIRPLAPHLQIVNSLWESFSFTPKVASEVTIRLTRTALGCYILSYISHPPGDEKPVIWIVRQPGNWKLRFYLSGRDFEETIEDASHFLSLSKIPLQLRIAEAFAMVDILLSSAFAGYEVYHQRYDQKVVPQVVCGLLLVVCLLFSRNVFRKRRALENALKLVTVVEHATQNKTSIETATLTYTYSDYKR
ncbi:MAG: hypothetical protein JSS10_03025 [Verrucomicrobia bacterium]|nr:hypothetical protein [Verrucomicrobiota bacterium]